MAKFTVASNNPPPKIISFQIDCDMTREELRIFKTLMSWNATVPMHLHQINHIHAGDQEVMNHTMRDLHRALQNL